MAKTAIGISNISYGLPCRRLVNRAFLLMAAAVGLDAAILDPTDVGMMSAVRAANLLVGKDPSCSGFIRAYRQGQLAE
jgi:5-methyltetrahydrofolate--homocysteine methyltransferase